MRVAILLIHVSIEGLSANENKYSGEIKNNMLKTIAVHPLSLSLSLPQFTEAPIPPRKYLK
jgi:hypothetical protein